MRVPFTSLQPKERSHLECPATKLCITLNAGQVRGSCATAGLRHA